MTTLTPEFLLLVKHLRLKLMDLRDLAEDQMGQDLLDVLERVIDHVVQADPDDNCGLLIAADHIGDAGTIGVRSVRFD